MRRLLPIVTATLASLGALAATYVFLGSLAPSAKTEAERPRVPVPTLAPGQFAYVDNPVKSNDWSSEYLFVRTMDGSLRVFEIPTIRGRFTMPDRAWWRPGHLCRTFEPSFPAGQFQCLDPQAPAWVREQFRWSLDGKSLYPQVVEDMLTVRGKVEAGDFIPGAKPEA